MAQDNRITLGVAGLGRGFMLMLPTLANHPHLKVGAAADPVAASRDRFTREFPGARTYDTVEEMCRDPGIEAVYVATPHQLHVAHVGAAARAGKHVLVEKPMALSLSDCRAMISQADKAGVHLIVGHSHGFDLPYLRTRALIDSGAFGQVRMIQALNYTDYLYRPRRPEELDTAQGGGVLFSQAPHQVDVVRLLAGSEVRSVRAVTGAWDPARPTEGAYMALLTFENGAAASLNYNGYAHFDTDALNGWIGEMGNRRDPEDYGAARRKLATVKSPGEEAALKAGRNFANSADTAAALPDSAGYNHFGMIVVSCTQGDLRPTPTGIEIYADTERRTEILPPVTVPRAEVIDELHAALRHGRPSVHSGKSAMRTLACCLAIEASAREGREVSLAEILDG